MVIILNQDKTQISKCEVVRIEDKSYLDDCITEDDGYRILGHTGCARVLLGEYEDKERCEEIIEEINNHIRRLFFIKHGVSNEDKECYMESFTEDAVYEMPEK